MKTGSGDWATFTEMGSVPSSMCAARIAMAVHAVTKKSVMLQSDCVRAYIQAELGGPPTWIRLPRHMWPRSWYNADGTPRFTDPVCRLRKALYGHPRAGDYWADKLSSVLDQRGYERDEAWPGIFVKDAGKPTMTMIIVYVDDLIFVGDEVELNKIIPIIRTKVEMEDPTSLSKYLGVHHRVTRDDKGTSMFFDMRDYFKSAASTLRRRRARR